MKKYLLFLLFATAVFSSAIVAQASSVPSPIAHWNFNDENAVNGGVITDSAGQYTAQNKNGSWISNGFSGGAINFRCSNGTYGMISNSLPPLSNFSVLYRLKLGAFGSQTLNSSFGFNVSLQQSGDGMNDSINVLGDGMSGSGITKQFSSNGTWEHLAFVYNNDGYYYYRNGVFTAYTAGLGRSFPSGQWTFGAAGVCNTDIQMDEIKIYNTALTSNQVAEEYNYNKLKCNADVWQCEDWGACSANGSQARSCSKIFECEFTEDPSPPTSQSCTYTPPMCTSWTYSDWSDCQSNSTKTRSIVSSSPSNCSGGSPVFTQSCAYTPPQPITPPPVYQPPQLSCTADSWSCGEWNACSLSGIQNRSCRKTFDCPSAESAPPAVDQSCESPNKPTQQLPQIPQSNDEISNQDSIVRATVKLICPVDSNRASQGSGTIINSNGTILTNKHVVEGTLGCLVGFVDNFNDEPYFGERQIADILKMSPSEDVAVLKIRNPQNTSLPYVNIATGNSKNLRLGTKIITYGYPAKFGTNITYTSGDFSGTNGNYLKTTAIIEHGNSGGGAYIKDGTFIGVPSAVIRGELNALGYVLSINTINAWLGNSSIASNSGSNNNYSRVSSVLENIDLKKLDSLQLIIPNTKETTKETPQNNKTASKTIKSASSSSQGQAQKNSYSSVSEDLQQKVIDNKKAEQVVNNQQQEKQIINSWPKRFLFWLANFF